MSIYIVILSVSELVQKHKIRKKHLTPFTTQQTFIFVELGITNLKKKNSPINFPEIFMQRLLDNAESSVEEQSFIVFGHTRSERYSSCIRP